MAEQIINGGTAKSVFVVDSSGNPVTATNGVPINLAQAGGVALSVDSSGRIITIPFLSVILNQASSAQTSWTSSDLYVGNVRAIALDINVTAVGTNVTFVLSRKGLDGIYYPIYSPSAISSAPTKLSTSIGPGCTVAAELGANIQLSLTTTGGAATFSASIIGK
jgi:hypothetical protein